MLQVLAHYRRYGSISPYIICSLTDSLSAIIFIILPLIHSTILAYHSLITHVTCIISALLSDCFSQLNEYTTIETIK